MGDNKPKAPLDNKRAVQEIIGMPFADRDTKISQSNWTASSSPMRSKAHHVEVDRPNAAV